MAVRGHQRGAVVELWGVLLPLKRAAADSEEETEEEAEEEPYVAEAVLLDASGPQLAAALPPRRAVLIQEDNSRKEYGVVGRFPLAHPWWRVHVKAKKTGSKYFVQGYPSYFLRTDIEENNRQVFSLFLKECGVPELLKEKFFTWLPMESMLSFRNLEEKLNEFQVSCLQTGKKQGDTKDYEECLICDYFVLVGEPTAVSCPIVTLPVLHSNYNLTWYKNGSATPVTTERHARIHQREGLLWFIPATLDDSGLYECDVRSLNHSNRKTINLTVFKNDNSLCFNGKMKFEQKLMSTKTGKIICPDLELFKDEDNNQPEVHWYKECKPGFLEDKRLLLAEGENAVLINNVSVQDRGNYTCRMVYTYMGRQYNISRTISLEVKERPLQVRPEFIYPKNNTIQAELGSHVVMECNVSSGINGLIPFWQVNDKDVDSFDSTYREQFYEEVMSHGLVVSGTKFNISQVKQKDYAHKFFCHFIYGSQEFTAYIKLEPPARNIQGYLIGGGVSLIFLVFFTLSIYKIFKVDIVLWYRDSCHPFLGKRVSDEKIYDAYVLYPKNRASCLYSSDIFALKILPEVLERQCGYNLFIFGRDDLPGEAVISVADEKIRQSRRVIIVLVPEPSCYSVTEDVYEKQLAMYNALIQEGIKVILIELEKIQDYANMPEGIKYVKEKHGAIRWKGDFSERSHSASTRFWKKVRYHMPSRKTTSPSALRLLPKDFDSP